MTHGVLPEGENKARNHEFSNKSGTTTMDSDEMKMTYLATVKPSGKPHVTRVLSVLFDGKIYLETGRASVKVKNILKNNNVAAVTINDYGNCANVRIIEGKARVIIDEEAAKHIVAKSFKKHPWRPRLGKGSPYVLVEITPTEK